MKKLTTALLISAACMSATPTAFGQDSTTPQEPKVTFVPFTKEDRAKLVVPTADAKNDNSQPLEAPVLDTQNSTTHRVNLAGDSTKESSPIKGDDEWATKLKEIQDRIDKADKNIKDSNESARQDQLKADEEFRKAHQDIINSNDSVTVEGDVLYPPEVAGGDAVKAPITAPKVSSVPLPPNATVADKIVAAAKTQIGVPYVWGGTAANVGLDCSGLTQWAYKQAGINIPRVTYDQINAGQRVSASQAQPGDLVFYSGTGHVALYIGNGEVIHAPQPGEVVKYSSIDMMPVEAVVRVI